jgi:hypothetical protein
MCCWRKTFQLFMSYYYSSSEHVLISRTLHRTKYLEVKYSYVYGCYTLNDYTKILCEQTTLNTYIIYRGSTYTFTLCVTNNQINKNVLGSFLCIVFYVCIQISNKM